MNAHTSGTKAWTISKEALDKLLNCLDGDERLAAEKYELIRRKLVVFFESRGCHSSEDCADISITRAARKILEGQTITTANVANYFLGIAGNVLQEYWREVKKMDSPLTDELLMQPRYSVDPEKNKQMAAERLRKEQKAECLERCLQSLSQANRQLIIQYYEGETDQKIKNRKKIAEQLGISSNALGIRALRIRDKLETCCKRCLEQMDVS